MKTRTKYIITGVFMCSAVSFVAASCMQYMSGNKKTYIDMNTLEFVQEEEIKEGSPTATIKTSAGDIKIVLYPEYAPEAVNNFTSLAESGYYDNTYVYNFNTGTYFSAGSPKKNGELDENKPEGTKEFEQELHQNLWPFRGAVCSLSTGQSGGFWDKITGKSQTLNGSRFAVINSVDFTDDFKQELLDANENTTLAEKFIKLGGMPQLAQQITVFGQTYEGFDVIDKLTNLDAVSDEANPKIPAYDIMIDTIEIGTYHNSESQNNTKTKPASKESEQTTSTEVSG